MNVTGTYWSWHHNDDVEHVMTNDLWIISLNIANENGCVSNNFKVIIQNHNDALPSSLIDSNVSLR